MPIFHQVLTAVVVAALAAGAADPGSSLAGDERALKEAGVAIDADSLLDFFRQRTLSETTQQRLITLIKQLGADDFETRERATKELIGLGAHARAALEQAVNDPDAEVSARAKRCLAAIPARAE